MKSSSSNPNRSRRQIEFFSGNRRKSPFSPHDLDELVARLRALSNIQVVIGPTGKFLLGGDKSLLVIPDTTSALTFTGEWDPNRKYKFQEQAIISKGSNAGTYVYINQTASTGHAPYAGGGWWVQLPTGQLGTWM